ncbi:MAG: putative metalloprotease CJM1_0395 family protein [bacterium]
METRSVDALARALQIQKTMAQELVSSASTRALETPAAGGSCSSCSDGDKVSISAEARALAEAIAPDAPEDPDGPPGTDDGDGEPTDLEGANPSNGPRELSAEDQGRVRELQTRDREVRAHEAAHGSAGGALAGGASFTLETGPDGRQYAVGGEVPITIAEGSTPAETIRNAQQVRRAALAPAEPSAADRQVAADASALETRARVEQARESGSSGAEGGEATPGTIEGKVDRPEELPEAQNATAVEAGGSVDPRARAYAGDLVAQLEPALDLFA